ncbi:MAG TPA: S1/P1 Nuclease [Cryomorphaceae bacterium]|nr:S1/P1 Nuclease [Owenweeksia sp.]HAD96201.1 S1/P1 Nuclease [Cryomorphaceae bacterium]HBF18715.1 S1/P1 Nuclease [Cryomorphaceae bacterium]|tara:strand:+ start:12059 stop:12829 length:771 start_codon:yes stop_codon:yes gene_type:complete
MKRILLSAILISFISTTEVLAWGQTGHRVVGQVAENHLTKKARKNIKKLLGSESLAIASAWMDEVKSDDTYDHTHDWHWVTIPEGETYSDTEKNPKGDLVEAIGRMKAILKSDTASREHKVVALRFLVHLVGDLHQPLHVGTGEDKGGNDVKVKWFYQSSNLHRVWDSEIIDSKQLSYTELAEAVDHASADQIKKWQSGTVAEWAQEAITYREQVYETGDTDKMGYRYMYQNWDLLQDQLEKGGIRLAGLLNEIFG